MCVYSNELWLRKRARVLLRIRMRARTRAHACSLAHMRMHAFARVRESQCVCVVCMLCIHTNIFFYVPCLAALLQEEDTVLHWAAKCGYVDVVKKLLEGNRADVNAKAKVLHLCARMSVHACSCDCIGVCVMPDVKCSVTTRHCIGRPAVVMRTS